MAVSCSWSSLITTSLTTLYSLVTISLFKPTTLINLSVFIKKKIYPHFVATIHSQESMTRQLAIFVISMLYLYQLHIYLMKATFESKLSINSVWRFMLFSLIVKKLNKNSIVLLCFSETYLWLEHFQSALVQLLEITQKL